MKRCLIPSDRELEEILNVPTIPKSLELTVVKRADVGILIPIGVFSILPPSTVNAFTTNASLILFVDKLRVDVTVKIPIVEDGTVSGPVMVSPATFTKRES